MEQGGGGGGGGAAGDPGPAALGRGGLDVLQHTVGSLLSSYGWFILLAAVAIYLLIQKLSQSLASRPSSQPGAADAAVEPELVVRRQEALAAARLRMQEELNAQAERYKEKQRQLEEEKRRQKIAMWESMQEGRSYKGNLKLSQEAEPGASSSAALPKSRPNKKPLRGGVTCSNPHEDILTGAAITHCLEKEVAPVPGDQAGEAPRQGDEGNLPSASQH